MPVTMPRMDPIEPIPRTTCMTVAEAAPAPTMATLSYDEAGTAKSAWTDAFYPQLVAFDPGSICWCDNSSESPPCASSLCPSGQQCVAATGGGVCMPQWCSSVVSGP